MCVFTRALMPPFIGRRGDFYIPETPSSSKNIPNVNTYKNVFFISYIYKSVTSSHFKPGLFGTTTLTLLLAGSRIPRSRLPKQTSGRFPNFRPPKFVTSLVPDSGLPQVHDSEASQVRDSRKSHVRDSKASQAQDSRKSHVPCP
jgi:hypothetical protein